MPRALRRDHSSVMAQGVADADLPSAARALVSKAVGWHTVAYSVPVTRLRRVSDGVDDEGKTINRMVEVEETNVVVAGWRGAGRFFAVWSAERTDEGVAPKFKADVAYWWQREHEAWADLPRELVRWATPWPCPVKVGFAELKRRLASTAELV